MDVLGAGGAAAAVVSLFAAVGGANEKGAGAVIGLVDAGSDDTGPRRPKRLFVEAAAGADAGAAFAVPDNADEEAASPVGPKEKLAGNFISGNLILPSSFSSTGGRSSSLAEKTLDEEVWIRDEWERLGRREEVALAARSASVMGLYDETVTDSVAVGSGGGGGLASRTGEGDLTVRRLEAAGGGDMGTSSACVDSSEAAFLVDRLVALASVVVVVTDAAAAFPLPAPALDFAGVDVIGFRSFAAAAAIERVLRLTTGATSSSSIDSSNISSSSSRFNLSSSSRHRRRLSTRCRSLSSSSIAPPSRRRGWIRQWPWQGGHDDRTARRLQGAESRHYD
ncbi:BQ2448_5824 [Microbotryum intermedium]|uniref:BQ2448_5824 protein n=1 Tax=Microbotryum intermedium TaxID=269621 RepID=A0A238F7M7_9BASI|nr:BQ2448_5824 [Microbotryum intermedium]